MYGTMRNFSILFAVAAIPFAALAYPPPEVAVDGVGVKIVGLEQGPGPRGIWDRNNLKCVELDATKDVPLTFTLSNGTERAVSGELAVWMNDDWQVLDNAKEIVALAAGEVKTVVRTARPGPRVLPALYPVHAQYSVAGRKPIHPIAVFRAKTPNRAFTRRAATRDALGEGSYRLDCGFARIYLFFWFRISLLLFQLARFGREEASNRRRRQAGRGDGRHLQPYPHGRLPCAEHRAAPWVRVPPSVPHGRGRGDMRLHVHSGCGDAVPDEVFRDAVGDGGAAESWRRRDDACAGAGCRGR